MKTLTISKKEREIVQEILKKYFPGETAVWVYGSRAKGNAKKFSDLDLAIDSTKPLSMSILTNIAFDLEESDLPYKVDIIDWQTTSEDFKKNIDADKVLFWKNS